MLPCDATRAVCTLAFRRSASAGIIDILNHLAYWCNASARRIIQMKKLGKHDCSGNGRFGEATFDVTAPGDNEAANLREQHHDVSPMLFSDNSAPRRSFQSGRA